MIVHNEINLICEAVLLLHLHVDKKKNINDILYSIKRPLFDSPLMRRYLNDIKCLHRKISFFTTDIEEIIDFYFHSFAEEYSPAGFSRCMLCLLNDLETPTLEEFSEKMDRLSLYNEGQICAHLLKSFCAPESVYDSLNEIEFDSFMSAVGRLLQTPEQAFVVFDCYKNFKKYISELKNIITNAVHYLEQFSQLFNSCFELTNELCTSPDAVRRAFGDRGALLLQTVIKTDSDWEKLTIYPIFSLPIVCVDTSDGAGTAYICPLLFTSEDTAITDEAILDIMKCLSDNSRLRILHEISTRAMTNSQLSELLGLTSATISHHLAALSEMGFVFSSSKGTKVFYRSQQSPLLRFITGLKDYIISGSDKNNKEY